MHRLIETVFGFARDRSTRARAPRNRRRRRAQAPLAEPLEARALRADLFGLFNANPLKGPVPGPDHPAAFLVSGYGGSDYPRGVEAYLKTHGALVHESYWNDLLKVDGTPIDPRNSPGGPTTIPT